MVFFFQAEDGIRYGTVTGVQTCALPIQPHRREDLPRVVDPDRDRLRAADPHGGEVGSEEHTSELQSQFHIVCRLLLEKKKPCIHSSFCFNAKTCEDYPNQPNTTTNPSHS